MRQYVLFAVHPGIWKKDYCYMTSIPPPYNKHWKGITIATHSSFDSWPYQPSQRIPMETIFWHWKAKWFFPPFPLAMSQMVEKNLCNANIISNSARASSACAFGAPGAMARFNRNYGEGNGHPWTQLKSQHCHWVLLNSLFFNFSLLPQCIVQLINFGPKRTAQCIILLLYTLKKMPDGT